VKIAEELLVTFRRKDIDDELSYDYLLAQKVERNNQPWVEEAKSVEVIICNLSTLIIRRIAELKMIL
jgi:hypothetical protein